MPFLTRLFGVTESAADRDRAGEATTINGIVENSLRMQAGAATRQHRGLCRGTHAKGVCARAVIDVLDVAGGRDAKLASRLARGLFARPGAYPAIVRFANADPNVNSDFKADVRSLSFSVDLGRGCSADPGTNGDRQDFSMQNATTLPINDAPAFLATTTVLTASNPMAGLWSLVLRDKLRVIRTLLLAQVQSRQRVIAYQHLRFWSTVPFRHGPSEVVKFSATPSPNNPAHPLRRDNPNGVRDELARHLSDDGRMAAFDIGIQFLDIGRMTYWGKRRDADFWTENASVAWREADSPFHTVARLTLLADSQLSPEASDAVYFDVTKNALPDSAPVGSINRARCPAEAASRKARQRTVEESLS